MALTESERKYWRMRLNHLRSETEAVLRILAEDAKDTSMPTVDKGTVFDATAIRMATAATQ